MEALNYNIVISNGNYSSSTYSNSSTNNNVFFGLMDFAKELIMVRTSAVSAASVVSI